MGHPTAIHPGDSGAHCYGLDIGHEATVSRLCAEATVPDNYVGSARSGWRSERLAQSLDGPVVSSDRIFDELRGLS